MRAKAKRALVRFTGAAIDTLRDDDEEFLQGGWGVGLGCVWLVGGVGGRGWREGLAGRVGRKGWREGLAGRVGGKGWQEGWVGRVG